MSYKKKLSPPGMQPWFLRGMGEAKSARMQPWHLRGMGTTARRPGLVHRFLGGLGALTQDQMNTINQATTIASGIAQGIAQTVQSTQQPQQSILSPDPNAGLYQPVAEPQTDWTPWVIGACVVAVAGVGYMVVRKKSPTPNRSRRTSVRRVTRRRASRRTGYVFPEMESWPIGDKRHAQAAMRYLWMGRVSSRGDYTKIRRAIERRYGKGFWTGPSWGQVSKAKKKRGPARLIAGHTVYDAKGNKVGRLSRGQKTKLWATIKRRRKAA